MRISTNAGVSHGNGSLLVSIIWFAPPACPSLAGTRPMVRSSREACQRAVAPLGPRLAFGVRGRMNECRCTVERPRSLHLNLLFRPPRIDDRVRCASKGRTDATSRRQKGCEILPRNACERLRGAAGPNGNFRQTMMPLRSPASPAARAHPPRAPVTASICFKSLRLRVGQTLADRSRAGAELDGSRGG
jgi:hypothetical protein